MYQFRSLNSARRTLAISLMMFTLSCQVDEGQRLFLVEQARTEKDTASLVQALKDSSTRVPVWALRSLIRFPSAQADVAISAFMNEVNRAAPPEEPRVHWLGEILASLMETNRVDAAAVAFIEKLSQDSNPDIRQATFSGLGRRQKMNAPLWAILTSGLGAKAQKDRAAARNALLAKGWAAVVPLLDSKAPKESVGKLVFRITGYSATSLRRWKSEGTLGIYRIAEAGVWPRDKAQIVAALASGRPRLQRVAARALAKLAPPEEGVNLLLASPASRRFARLWGEYGATRVRKIAEKQGGKSVEPWATVARGQATERSLQKAGPSLRPILAAMAKLIPPSAADSNSLLRKLRGYAIGKDSITATEAALALWQAGYWPTAPEQSFRHVASALLHSKGEQRRAIVDALSEMAGWGQSTLALNALLDAYRASTQGEDRRLLLMALLRASSYLHPERLAGVFAAVKKRESDVSLLRKMTFRSTLAARLEDRHHYLERLGPISARQWRRLLKGIGHARLSAGVEALLRAALKVTDARVRRFTLDTIERLKPETLLPDLRLAMTNAKPSDKDNYAAVLAVFGQRVDGERLWQLHLNARAKSNRNTFLRAAVSCNYPKAVGLARKLALREEGEKRSLDLRTLLDLAVRRLITDDVLKKHAHRDLSVRFLLTSNDKSASLLLSHYAAWNRDHVGRESVYSRVFACIAMRDGLGAECLQWLGQRNPQGLLKALKALHPVTSARTGIGHYFRLLSGLIVVGHFHAPKGTAVEVLQGQSRDTDLPLLHRQWALLGLLDAARNTGVPLAHLRQEVSLLSGQDLEPEIDFHYAKRPLRWAGIFHKAIPLLREEIETRSATWQNFDRGANEILTSGDIPRAGLELALTWAKKAVVLSRSLELQALDTLALAHHRLGDSRGAVATQLLALRIYGPADKSRHP